MSERPLALVTGGCRRLGAAIAARLAGAGWDLALHAHEASAPEPALAGALAEAGAAWTVTPADLAHPAAAATLVRTVAADWGRAPRLLVNAAATFGQDRLADADAAALIDQYAVNCAAPTLAMAAFAALPGAAGDRSVVNILDQRIAQPHGDQLGYTLSKIALAGATRIAARELAPAVRVNGVAPGLTIPTDAYDADLMREVADAMPLALLPGPADVASAVLYLAGARATTGQVVFVDGGAALQSWDRDFARLREGLPPL